MEKVKMPVQFQSTRSKRLTFALLLGMSLLIHASQGADVPAATPNTTKISREEIFEFTQKPAITKQGEKIVISFGSKAKCDATVAVVDKDGKIVRHLASGVLGSNAPEPFKKNTLAQSLEWDGNDDAGKRAPDGCKVKVGLGLKASYALALGFVPAEFYAYGVACDQQGNAYVIDGSGRIRVFSRDGKYSKTITPMVGGREPKDYAAAYNIFGSTEAPLFLEKPEAIGRLVRGMGMTVSPSGLLTFTDWGYRGVKYLYTIQTNGAALTRRAQVGPNDLVDDNGFLTYSKDEKTVYVSGMDRGSGGGQGGEIHSVFRRGINDPTPSEWPKRAWGTSIPIFVGEKDKAGDDNAHFNKPRGVASDKDGNVYVCDFGNNRVQIFSAEAKYLRTLKVDRPDQIAVHRQTGDVYVLVPSFTKHEKTDFKRLAKAKIVKLSSEGKELAVFEFPDGFSGCPGWITNMALDDSATPAILWLSAVERVTEWDNKGLWRIQDNGTSFEKLGDSLAYEKWNPWADTTSEYISVDREDRWMYMKNRRLPGFSTNVARFDTATGKRDETWLFSKKELINGIDEHFIGPDGLLYLRGCCPSTKQGALEYVWRVKPDTGEEVPFSGTKDGRISFSGLDSPKFHRDGFGVAPNGDIYVMWFVKKEKPYNEPWREGYGFGPIVLHHYGADGSLKREDILPGIPSGSTGVRIDRKNNLYLALNLKPMDKPCPELLWSSPEAMACYKKLAPTMPTTVGTLARFAPEGGKIEAVDNGNWHFGHKRAPAKITGLKDSYVGLGKLGVGCVCMTCRMDLDGFDRTFSPIADLSCVMVLDANFNCVLRVGNYGNADNQGPQSAFPKPEIALKSPSYVTVNDKSLYIADRGNMRVIKATLGYTVEELIPLP